MCVCLCVVACRCPHLLCCFTRQMLITGDSDRDRDSDSCPVLFDTFVDYRSKASYEGSKNDTKCGRNFFFCERIIFDKSLRAVRVGRAALSQNLSLEFDLRGTKSTAVFAISRDFFSRYQN